ncbi:hypothetical protein BT63DRAFT_57704 [Microthyrium microscopicum]|uniref:Uncharacterized protein n=1 Tax=Microthyrium microscopicum TaxID=703497 RepID=A0A6A6U481_9PEZI|nr:hypothetical protein BT63DRAFT_57704 [Microthyrium microscopicum]
MRQYPNGHYHIPSFIQLPSIYSHIITVPQRFSHTHCPQPPSKNAHTSISHPPTRFPISREVKQLTVTQNISTRHFLVPTKKQYPAIQRRTPTYAARLAPFACSRTVPPSTFVQQHSVFSLRRKTEPKAFLLVRVQLAAPVLKFVALRRNAGYTRRPCVTDIGTM